jgi:hypothetical protein
MKYKAELYIITHQQVDKNGNATGETERINIPIHAFEVEGGANRKIVLASMDEISVTSEFEQARAYKNLIFYVPPTKDFLAVRLMEIGKELMHFDITFVISVFSHGKLIKALRFSPDGAWFSKTPTIEGGSPKLLKAWVRFHELQLLHGQYDSRLKKFVHRTI